MKIEVVCRIDPLTSGHRYQSWPARHPATRPISGDTRTEDPRPTELFAAVVGEHRKVWGFDLDAEGNPHNQRVVYDFAPGRGGDGMRLDQQGNLYVAAGIMTPRGPHETAEVRPPGIYVISPQGELLHRIPIAEDVLTNLAFGGKDGKTIYITAGKSLFQAQVPVAGQVAYPRWA